ncbi:MAG: hypothetical protein BWK79_01375 [Beggiatoa sp. IS2]|nr:MAG: hypothetical protein BWK79_01375 [Beggiatoa sp. IS2]
MLADIHAKIAENAYILYEATATIAGTHSQLSEDNWQQVIAQCSDYVQSVSESAEASHLIGLQEVCKRLHQRLFTLQTKNQVDRKAFCHEIERWPRLVANYLRDPENEIYRHHLVTFVANPLESTQAEELSRLLQLPKESEDLPILQTAHGEDVTVLVAESDEEMVRKSDEETYDDTIEDVLQTDELRGDTQTHLLDNEAEVMPLPKGDVEPLANEELLYSEDLDSHFPENDKESITVDNDESLAVDEENTTFGDDESLAIGDEEEVAIDDDENIAIGDEESVTIDDDESTELQTEATERIEETVQTTPQAQKETKTKTIADDATESEARVTPETLTIQPTELSTLSDEVMQLGEVLNNILAQFLSAEDDSDIFLQSIEEYTNAVQTLWEIAEKQNLIGMQEVCTFINDNVFETSSQPQAERAELQELFATWPQLVAVYLRDPARGARSLIEHLQKRRWLLPLLDKPANTLLLQLMQGAMAFQMEAPKISTAAVHQKQPETTATPIVMTSHVVEKPIQKIVLKESEEELLADELEEEESEETTADLAVAMPDWGEAFIAEDVALAFEQDDQDILLNREVDAEEIIFEKQELSLNSSELDAEVLQEFSVDDETIEEFATDEMPYEELVVDESTTVTEITEFAETLESQPSHYPVEQKIVSPPSQLVTSKTSIDQSTNVDTLDSLALEMVEAQSDLTKALSKLVVADDESAELLEAVEEYVDNVQAISAVAETAGMGGLSEVCAIIKDNILELSTEGRAIRRAAQPYIELWPKLVQVYLHSPVKGARDLVAHLSLPSWPLPLDEPRGRILLRQLAPEAENPELSPQNEVAPVETDRGQVSDAKLEAVIASDTLALLTRQLADLASNHTFSLNDLVRADGDSEKFLVAVETYTENVQTIADTAEIAGLMGIQDVCTFINDNVMALNGQDKAGRLVAHDVLAKWPQWVKAYLQNPIPASAELVNQLRNAHWLIPLTEAQATTLQKRLLKPLTPHTAESEIFEEEIPFESEDYTIMEEWPLADVAATTTTDLALEIDEPQVTSDPVFIAPELLEIVLPPMLDTASQLANVLHELLMAEEGSEELFTAIATYTENVQAVWDTAEMTQLVGLQEVCLFINDNIMLLGSHSQAERQATQSVFAEWPERVMAYLQNPSTGTPQLIQHLQRIEWPQPLDEVQTATLQSQLLGVPTSFNENLAESPEETTVPTEDEFSFVSTSEETGAIPESSTFVLAPMDVLELVSNQITDVTEGMSAALEECVTMENDNPALLESIENYTNQVQAIWDAADMAGLRGLQEVCTFVNDNLLALSAQERDAKITAQPYFAEWPAQVLAYLAKPKINAQTLVTFLQNPAWPNPLAEDRANEVLSLLTNHPQPLIDKEEQGEIASSPVIPAKAGIQADTQDDLNLPAVGKITLGHAEVLEILTSELETAQEELTKELQKFVTLANDAPGFAMAAENYTDQVQRLRTAAEMVGLEGLQNVCTLIVDNVNILSTQDLTMRSQAQGLLETWPQLVLAYLQDPENHVVALVKYFRESEWPQPLNDEQAYSLLEQLAQGSTAPEETEEEKAAFNRQTQAQPEDVLLTIPGDINRELLEAYLQEAPQNASDFSHCIQNIVQHADIKEIERAQRIAHTLKGSSNIIGIKGIANIAHNLEDTLEYLAKHQVAPPPALTETMIEAADCLESMVDALLGQDGAPPQSLQVLQSVLDWANRIDQGNLDAPLTDSTRVMPESAKVTESVPTQAKAPSPQESAVNAGEVATPEQILRVPTKTIDNLMRLVGEISITLGQIQEKLKHVTGSTRLLTEQGLVIQQRTFELENIVDVRGVGSENYRQTISMDVDFDPLEFEEYNELHSVTHSFVESIADSRELGMSIRNDLAELETMFIQQERLNKEFQSTIMTTRMVPVNTILSKLQRNVRQTCRATGKQAELVISGTDILVDSDVLNNLADPLMHILRNSIDHGLETPEERKILGKPESGTIQLRFYREGNNVVVSCQDDGQGLNYTNIRYTAIQRGLVKENQEVTEADLARLILMSGFSTKAGVTQVSGRGVGMDVVHTNIRQMKGTLDLSSQTGKGLTVLIKLPMTLVTVHVLVVRVGEQRFGIPTNHIERALEPGVGEIRKVGKELMLQLDKRAYAIKSLGDLLKVPGAQAGVAEEETRPITLVREETGVTAVVVDELLDTHDLVMKNMGKYVTKVHGVAGASILGDGSVVPLLDLPELLRSAMQAVMSSFLADHPLDASGMPLTSTTLPYVMIVDDSLSVRKSLSILVEEAGCEPLLAKDGLEAIEVMNQTRPRVMLVDMEMPRMNGLELTAHVRANPATQKIPIFMITSRTTEKHREQAKAAGVSAYLTKPYPEGELMELIDKALAGKI